MSKKFSLLALALALVMVLCSCGSKEKEFSYSEGIDENGFWSGVKALDYVTLPDFANLGVTSDDVDREIQNLMSQQAYMKKNEVTNRAVKDGDTLSIDYVGSVDGVEFEGGSTQGMGTEVTIGVTNYIDGFLDQLIGHKPGETFDINVTFPESYGNADLAGKPAVFKITINKIYEFEKYDLTDNFVLGVLSDEYGITTVDELKSMVRFNLVYDAVMSGSEFSEELPPQIAAQYIASQKHVLQNQADSYNMTLDDFVAAYYGAYGVSNYDDLKALLEYDAPVYAKEQIMLQAVAEQKNIKVTDADLEALYKEVEENYALQEAEFKREDLISTYGAPYIAQQALFAKVQQFFETL